MKTRKEALKYGLSFPGTYQEAPFHDDNWQLVRVNTAMTSVVAENGYSSENDSSKKNVSDTIRNSDNSKNKAKFCLKRAVFYFKTYCKLKLYLI